MLLSLLLLAMSSVEGLALQDAAPVTVDDLYLFEGPRSAVLSPDGTRAAYARGWIDAASREERSSLWIDRAALEEGEPDARSPVFSPDGKWIAFLSTRPRPQGWAPTPPAPPASEPATDLWLIPAAGGRAIPLAGPDKPYGRVFNDSFYGGVSFSPDGRRMVFVADDGRDPRTKEEIEADVIVVRPDQGESYTGYGAARVWVAHLSEKPEGHAATAIDRLTDDDAWYGQPRWSPDGKTLVVHANRGADRESARFSINKNYDLWAIDVASRALRQLTTGPGPEVSPRFSPDGKRIACLSIPRKGSHRDVFNLAVVTLGEEGPTTAVVFDHHGSAPASHPPPVFPLPDDCWDGEQLVFQAETGTSSERLRVDPRTAAAARAEPTARERRLAGKLPPSNAFLRERKIAPTRVVSWKNEGFTLEGVLTIPPVGEAPYRLLVLPHGGPHGRSSTAFNFTAQVFAGRGYAVFEPNFRGSSGYGQKFIDADRNDFGGGDMRDILSGIDHLVGEKLADPDRQFVFGSSYGGFMTSWLVGHTRQFKAAVAQNAVTDLNVMWGLSDLQSWTEWEFGGRPWEVPDAMRRHSPITYVDKVTTPTLVLHSREDRRCPLAMGRMFHQSLLARGVPTQMVVYPGENHGIRRPRHREDVLRRVLAWFANYGG
jgi:dipeptidyl aminopeptidase/acylaminoacyl peptidase